jgi:CRP-like cAMP-binding protein
MKTETQTKPEAALIAEHALFKNLAPQYLALLAETAMVKEFSAGELIFREGDPANRFYLILSGEVALEEPNKDRGSVLLQTIGDNEVLGWSWLFPPFYWHFDARTTKQTKAIFFYGTWLRESCDRDHDFGYEMMKRMTAVIITRLQAARKRLAQSEARSSNSNV